MHKDNVLDDKFRTQLMDQVDKLRKQSKDDFHPNSNDVVLDILHPALFCYVHGQTPVIESKDIPEYDYTEGDVVFFNVTKETKDSVKFAHIKDGKMLVVASPGKHQSDGLEVHHRLQNISGISYNRSKKMLKLWEESPTPFRVCFERLTADDKLKSIEEAKKNAEKPKTEDVDMQDGIHVEEDEERISFVPNMQWGDKKHFKKPVVLVENLKPQNINGCLRNGNSMIKESQIGQLYKWVKLS
eukprot:UN31612